MTFSLTTSIELTPGAQITPFDSGSGEKTYRVELTDGRHFQANAKLHQVLELLRTPMTLSALAMEFEQRMGQSVPLDQLQQLSHQLMAQGVIVESGKADATPVIAEPATSSYLGLHYKRDLLSPAVLAPIARLLQGAFYWGTAAILLPLIIGAHIFAYRELGFPPNLQMTDVSWPLLYTVILVSILFHELGHLAACHRWQCPHGPLGVGLYFFNPVFYVDVTAAWRLTRYQRAVVDLGGMYIQLLFVPLALGLYWLTHDPTYLLTIAMIDLVLIGNLEPFLKLDGYWLLSDLTGVANLHARTGEAAKRFLAGILWRIGWRKEAPAPAAFSQWSGWVRIVLFIYMGISIALWPVLIAAMLPLMIDAVLTYPALWQTAFSQLLAAGAQGDVGAMVTQLNTLFLPTLTVLNTAFLFKIAWSRRQKSQKAKVQPQMQMQPA